ncbi:DUF2591 family protein [Paraburkholderia aspalathi]|uniref:phage protein NinX family protein n=1 Tax=Paraburkholderia aspalathi TaxID=1324617 RepID=UPI0038BDFC40
MKVSELRGLMLDVWVCRAELEEFQGLRLTPAVAESVKAKIGYYPYHPSLDWNLAGPIIDREKIGITFGTASGLWHAMAMNAGVLSVKWHITAPTPLVAAMRCYVALKFGEEVPDEVPA